MKKTVLLTGATGFIGKYIAQALVEKGYALKCLVRESSDTSFLQTLPDTAIVVGELTQPQTLAGIGDGVDFCIHLAAMGHVSSVSEESYRAFVALNEAGTQNLIDALKASGGVEKFVHFSSTAAMGHVGDPVLDETSQPNPLTPYQKSKLRSEDVANKAAQEGFPAVIVRPCMVYGVGGKGEFYKFYRLMIRGRFPKVGKGQNLTPLVHVTDVAQGAILAMEKGQNGETYLLTSETSIPMDEMRNLTVQAAGVQAKYPYIPAKLALTGAKMVEKIAAARGKEPMVTYRNMVSTITDRTFDITKAKTQLGYAPQVDFAQGIQETVQWFCQQDRA